MPPHLEAIGKYDIVVTGTELQGNYKVTFVNGTLTITAKMVPEASDFVYDGPSPSVYDGTVRIASVTSDKYGMGRITVRYFTDSGYTLEVIEAKDAGTYYVAIDVAEGKEYSAEEKIYADTWTFVINKAYNVITVEKTSHCVGKEFNIGATDIAGSPEFTYEIISGGSHATVDSKGNITGKSIGEARLIIRVAEQKNYLSSELTVDINIHDHIKEKIPGVMPTSTEQGRTEGYKCSECGDILVKQEPIAPTGTNTPSFITDEPEVEYKIPENDDSKQITITLSGTSQKDRTVIVLSQSVIEEAKGKTLIVSVIRVEGTEDKFTVTVEAVKEEKEPVVLTGEMDVTLPYDKSKGSPSVRWVEGDQLMTTISIDESNEKITFRTTHNSTYVVEYESEPEPVPEESSEISANTLFITGVMAVVIALFALAFVINRMRK